MTLSADPKYLGAQIGVTAVLHTWSQTLVDHPHLHCLVTGGGLSDDDVEWVETRKGFFLPVQVLASLFRGKFLAFLKQAYEQDKLTFAGEIAHLARTTAFKHLLNGLYQKAWIVYCKQPFGSAKDVIDYLGRLITKEVLFPQKYRAPPKT